MKKLYEKSELTFALIFIGIYCVSMSASDSVSAGAGFSGLLSLAVITALSLTLWIFIRKNGLSEKYGLCKAQIKAKKTLYYLPLATLLTVNLWHGARLNMSPAESLIYIFTMLGVGFAEEVIFRGLLFNAMAKDSLKAAVAVSSITFGLGHIINLFNGSGMEITENLFQIISAVAIGFMFVILYIKSKSLVACILTHGIFNSLSAFSDEATVTAQGRIVSTLFIIALCIGYSMYLLLTDKKNGGRQ